MSAGARHLTASMVVLDMSHLCVLLVHHNATGKWVFPGGHVDEGEAPHEAAAREVLEETGVKTVITPEDFDLPGMTALPAPWVVAEMAAPAKPQRGEKPAEAAHTHVDMLYIGHADSDVLLERVADDGVSAVRWVDLPELHALHHAGETRAEVAGIVVAALLAGDL